MSNVYNLKDLDDLDETLPSFEVVPVTAPTVYKSEFERQLDVMADYYRTRVKKARSNQTIENTVRCLWSLHNKLGSVDFSEEWVSKAMAHLEGEGKNAKTRNTYSYAIRRFFTANGYPEINIPIYDYVDKEAKFHTLDEIKTILAKTRKVPQRAILNFLYYMAPRAGELCNIKMEDIDLTSSPALVTIYAKKTHKKRTVPIDDECLPSLKAWLQLREQIITVSGLKTQYLFFNQKGGQFTPKSIWEIVKKASTNAGIITHPHSFRHSRANHLLHIYHWDAPTVAFFIGDGLEMFYRIYSHTGTTDAVRAMNMMRKKMKV